MVQEIKVESGGDRLDKFLHGYFNQLSRSWIQKLINDKQILVNNQVTKPHYQLHDNDCITVKLIKPPEIDLTPDPKITWETIFESPDYLVINKPAGLVVHPAPGCPSHTLVNGLLYHYPQISQVGDDITRPGIVHRLDKEVSGLLIIALMQNSFDYFKKLFQTHKITKHYTALVFGTEIPDEGEISFPLGRSKTGRIVSLAPGSSNTEEKSALTKYEVIKRYSNYSLIRITTITGRTHQIRAHLHGLGHPVVGDQLYFIKRYQRLKSWNQLFLCADYLSFQDLFGKSKEFYIELPPTLKKIIQELNQD